MSHAELDSGRMASIAAHDLREPLRVMSGYLDLLVAHHEGRIQIDAARVAREAREASRRMADMLTSLVEFGRIGREAPHLAPVAMSELFADALANLSDIIERSKAEITSDPFPVIACDRVLIARVFQNLVGNALKFRVEAVPPRVHIGAKRTPDGWRFSIRDEGIGIPPGQEGRVFEPFTRLHGASFPGTGLGLAGCRHIVEAHGGRIWAESNQGPGTTFSFIIPGEDAP